MLARTHAIDDSCSYSARTSGATLVRAFAMGAVPNCSLMTARMASMRVPATHATTAGSRAAPLSTQPSVLLTAFAAPPSAADARGQSHSPDGPAELRNDVPSHGRCRPPLCQRASDSCRARDCVAEASGEVSPPRGCTSRSWRTKRARRAGERHIHTRSARPTWRALDDAVEQRYGEGHATPRLHCELVATSSSPLRGRRLVFFDVVLHCLNEGIDRLRRAWR